MKGIKRTDNWGVIDAWRHHKRARNSRGSLSTSTVPQQYPLPRTTYLYSYGLLIGVNIKGTCFLKDCTAPAGDFHSVTTSCHVNKAKALADVVMHPLVWEATPELKDREIPF